MFLLIIVELGVPLVEGVSNIEKWALCAHKATLGIKIQTVQTEIGPDRASFNPSTSDPKSGNIS